MKDPKPEPEPEKEGIVGAGWAKESETESEVLGVILEKEPETDDLGIPEQKVQT